MRYILLLISIAVLAACSQSPAEDVEFNVDETPVMERSPVSAVSADSTADIGPSAPASPTPLPLATYGEIEMPYEEAFFGTLVEAAKKPAEAPISAPAQPEHVTFTFDGSDQFHSAELFFFPLEHYLSTSADAPTHIANLEETLLRRPVQPASPLPLYPTAAYANRFITDPVYVNSPELSGVSFAVGNENGTEREFVHVFQGISNDKEFFITAILASRGRGSSGDANDDAQGEILSQVSDQTRLLEEELAGISNELAEAMQTLTTGANDDFPAPAPAAVFALPGVMFAYDPALSGQPEAERVPPVYTSQDGTALYLSGVPDAIEVSFHDENPDSDLPVLTIQPVRGATGQFYSTIPDEQKARVAAIEQDFQVEEDGSQLETEDGLNRIVQFPSGSGKRSIKRHHNEDGSHVSYNFEGVTRDGRYFVHFSQLLPVSGTIEEAMLASESAEAVELVKGSTYLDRMMQSLVIAAEASTDSSLPANSPDCISDAQFKKDLSIPDHTIIERGQPFTKKWLVQNTGTCMWTPAYQIVFAGGNPVNWGKASVVDIVAPGEETEISVEIISPEIPGNYHAWWQLADEAGEPFGNNYYALFEAPKPATDIPGYGVIEGEIGYPAGGVPAVTIYFLRTDGSQRFALETEDGWNRYANELPVGEYFVFARVAGDESDSGGGFTEAVKCEMTCDDHSLIRIVVEEGRATREINILDWYAPAGSFPLPK